MNSEHACFGCRNPFPTLKRLWVHEAMCKVSKCLKTDIAQACLLHLGEIQAQTNNNEPPNRPPQNFPIPLPTHIPSELNSNTIGVQGVSLIMHDNNLAWVRSLSSIRVYQHHDRFTSRDCCGWTHGCLSSYPHPHPPKTHTHDGGCGFLCGLEKLDPWVYPWWVSSMGLVLQGDYVSSLSVSKSSQNHSLLPKHIHLWILCLLLAFLGLPGAIFWL